MEVGEQGKTKENFCLGKKKWSKQRVNCLS